MIPNNDVKQAIVTRLRAYSTLVNYPLPDGVQGVREYNWRGTDFQYPNVRVEIESQTDATPEPRCTSSYIDWSTYVFSEHQSSLEADKIAGIVEAYFKDLSFTENNVKFQKIKVLESIPAIPEDEHTWRAQVRCRSIIYPV